MSQIWIISYSGICYLQCCVSLGLQYAFCELILSVMSIYAADGFLKSRNYLLRVVVSCLLIAGVLRYLLNSLGSSLQQQQQVLPMQHTIIFRAWLPLPPKSFPSMVMLQKGIEVRKRKTIREHTFYTRAHQTSAIQIYLSIDNIANFI